MPNRATARGVTRKPVASASGQALAQVRGAPRERAADGGRSHASRASRNRASQWPILPATPAGLPRQFSIPVQIKIETQPTIPSAVCRSTSQSQLVLLAASLFLFAREWKIVLGALLASLGELATGWLYYGTPAMRDYAHHLLHVREVLPLLEPKPDQMHSLRAFWSLLVPWPGLAFALYLITVVIALVLTLRLWRTTAPLSLRYSGLLLATVLVAPHLTIYYLVIVASAFLLL